MKRMMVMMTGLYLLAAPLMASPLYTGHDGPYGPMGLKIKLWLFIEIGKKSLDCDGFGICKLDWGIEKAMDPAKLDVNQAYGEAYFEDDGHFVIEFPKDHLKNETASTYFRSTFKVDEEVQIPRELLLRFKYPGDYRIKTGEYSISDKDGRLIVKF
jgi:hypothetical protein